MENCVNIGRQQYHHYSLLCLNKISPGACWTRYVSRKNKWSYQTIWRLHFQGKKIWANSLELSKYFRHVIFYYVPRCLVFIKCRWKGRSFYAVKRQFFVLVLSLFLFVTFRHTRSNDFFFSFCSCSFFFYCLIRNTTFSVLISFLFFLSLSVRSKLKNNAFYS